MPRKKANKETFYFVLEVKEDFTREVREIVNHPTESALLWDDVFENLKNSILNKSQCEARHTFGHGIKNLNELQIIIEE